MNNQKLRVGEVFHRDDYSIKIIEIRQVIDLDGKELWRVGTEIIIDDMLLMTNGFKVTTEPQRSHFTLYATEWVPRTITNYLNNENGEN